MDRDECDLSADQEVRLRIWGERGIAPKAGLFPHWGTRAPCQSTGTSFVADRAEEHEVSSRRPRAAGRMYACSGGTEAEARFKRVQIRSKEQQGAFGVKMRAR